MGVELARWNKLVVCGGEKTEVWSRTIGSNLCIYLDSELVRRGETKVNHGRYNSVGGELWESVPGTRASFVP